MKQHCFFVLITSVILFLPSVTQATSLSIPFSSQAPQGNWRQPWQDFCEEASVIMVNAYYLNKQLPTSIAMHDMLLLQKLKISRFGQSLDESTETLATLINSFYSWEARTVANPTLDAIKEEIAHGRPVIVPVAGTLLKNPYFKGQGPRYHMLVLSGYDDARQVFFTQEPGTRFGLDFQYSYDTIMGAIHDLVPGNIMNGPKQVLFTSSIIDASASLDADKDGLNKQDELTYGTILWLSDSDGDGLTDGDEAAIGSHPTKKESGIGNGSLIKSPSSAAIYRIENGEKRYIVNEQTFHMRQWRFADVRIVTDDALNAYSTGADIAHE